MTRTKDNPSKQKKTPRELIENITSIYDRFEIPQTLREHQARVAAVIATILDHWSGPAVDRDELIAAALLHDLGNITKMDLDAPHSRAMLRADEAHIGRLRAIKANLMEKYGAHEHVMTRTMLREIGASERIGELIDVSSFKHMLENVVSERWDRKIVAHADHRVSPYGIMPIYERLRDGAQRYGYPDPKRGAGMPSIDAAYELEEQIQANTTIDLNSITDERCAKYVEEFLSLKSPNQ